MHSTLRKSLVNRMPFKMKIYIAYFQAHSEDLCAMVALLSKHLKRNLHINSKACWGKVPPFSKNTGMRSSVSKCHNTCAPHSDITLSKDQIQSNRN